MKVIILLITAIYLFAVDTNKYDLLIYKNYRNNFIDTAMYSKYTWHIIKAQVKQESRFDKNAVSYVGAGGLLQIMPGTAKEIKKKKGGLGDIFDPVTAISYGTYYDRKMYNIWSSKRTTKSRVDLMFASYNAGAGNILKSQKACNNAVEYSEIIQCLHMITGKYSVETKTYVDRINIYYNEFKHKNLTNTEK